MVFQRAGLTATFTSTTATAAAAVFMTNCRTISVQARSMRKWKTFHPAPPTGTHVDQHPFCCQAMGSLCHSSNQIITSTLLTLRMPRLRESSPWLHNSHSERQQWNTGPHAAPRHCLRHLQVRHLLRFLLRPAYLSKATIAMGPSNLQVRTMMARATGQVPTKSPNHTCVFNMLVTMFPCTPWSTWATTPK